MSLTPEIKSHEDVLRENWGKASRVTLSATFTLFLLSRGEKSGANKILEAFGFDWTALNPYAVGLFGVPIVAILIFWSLWWARAFAQREAGNRWHERIATKSDLSQVGSKARTLALWSLFLYVILPIIGLAALEGKFLHGTFSFSTTGAYSCPKECVPEVGIFNHFWPSHGLQSVGDTPYRYSENLTYLPPWQAIIWVALGLGVLIYTTLYLRLIWSGRKQHEGPMA
jgi:hypothetical protein